MADGLALLLRYTRRRLEAVPTGRWWWQSLAAILMLTSQAIIIDMAFDAIAGLSLLRIFGIVIGVNTGFMPHGHCYLWTPGIVGTMSTSDIVIGFGYYVIPVVMLHIAGQVQPSIMRGIAWLMAAFVLTCGNTHWAALIVTWAPFYYRQAMIEVLCAIATLVSGVEFAIHLRFLRVAFETGVPRPAIDDVRDLQALIDDSKTGGD